MISLGPANKVITLRTEGNGDYTP